MDERSQGERGDETVPVVGFVVGARLFAFPVRHVQEIVPVVELTSLPRTPDQVLGVTTLRGTVIPIIDLRRLLEIEGSATVCDTVSAGVVEDESKIIVVLVGDRLIGCQVDAVTRVERLTGEQLLDAPETVTSAAPSVLGFAAVDDGTWVLLDPERLLTIDLLTLEPASA